MIASATSSAVPARPIGTLGVSRSNRPGAMSWNSVSISPGLTALTRIPSAATSRARPIVMVSIAPFVAA